MKKLLLILLLSPLFSMGMQQDSIGTKTVDGVRYVLHKIEKGQTLYAIARTYNADVNAIIKANPGSDKGIQADAVILIPRGAVKVKIEPIYGETIIETEFHTVKEGETLYKIATTYGVSVDDLKLWNNITGETISVGQKLAVSEARAKIAMPQVVDKKPTTEDKPSSFNTIKVDAPKPDEVITNIEVVKVEGNPSDEVEAVVIPAKKVKNIGDEVVESGKAEISSEGELNQERNFILHPSARIGTIVMITNPENNKSTFARVVGNYKAPADQVVKINPTLAKKLNITETTKEVKVNYAR